MTDVIIIQLSAEHRMWPHKYPISDGFFKNQYSSPNTCPICIILSVFEHNEHPQDNTISKMQKDYFLVLVGLVSSILEGLKSG
jgi:hypothetical protein